MTVALDFRRIAVHAATLFVLLALALHTQGAKAAEPSISHTSLLNGVTIDKGVLRLFGLKGYFFPEDANYQSFEVGEGLTAALTKASGEQVAEFWMVAFPQGGVTWELNPWIGVADLKGLVTEYKLSEPGDYVLTFKIAGEPIVRFPFTAVKEGGDDPYKPDADWYPSGPWERYGYIYIAADAEPSDVGPYFRKWYRKSGPTQTQKFQVKLLHGGKVIAESKEHGTATVNNRWKRVDMRIMKTEADGGQFFPASTLLDKPGDYELVVYREEAEIERLSFTVKDGKIQYQDRQVRGKTDPLDYIEGDRDAFWMPTN